MTNPPQTRVWPRHQVDLPVRIAPVNHTSEVQVPGLATELSRAGVAIYAGVDLVPGDLMEVEFESPLQLRVVATVRDRIGYCFGLAFVGVLNQDRRGNAESSQPESPTLHRATQGSAVPPSESFLRAQAVRTQDRLIAIILQRHEAFLRQKEVEINRTREELLWVRQMQSDIEIVRNMGLPETPGPKMPVTRAKAAGV